MKKLFSNMLAVAIAAFTFTACEDVPAPYPQPGTEEAGSTSSSLPYTSANLNSGWTLQNVTTDQPWSQGNSYTQATGYQKWDSEEKTNHAVEGWLISPSISTSGVENVKISFNHTIRYTNNVSGWENYHKVYASNDYDGNNFETATWVELNFKPVASPYNDWTLYGSGDIQLPTEMTNKESVYIGFWFKAPDNASTTWELQNFKVEEGIAEEGGGSEEPTSESIEVDCAKAVELANALADNGTSTETYTVTGYITQVVGNVSKNQQTFWMADTKDGGKVFEAYYANLPEGVTEFKAGMKVKITGNLTKYVKDSNVTPEIKNATVEILEKSGDDTPTPTPTPTGENLLTNGDFETWSGGLPTGWKSTTTASSATLSQSTDAHGGSYAVKVAHDAASNKRIAYKEITLKAGTYLMSFYVKAADAAGASVNPGYVLVGTDGKVSGSYQYGGYVNDITTTWQQVTNTITLDAQSTLNLLVMIPKNSGTDVIIDDFTLSTDNGGLVDDGGGETPTPEPTGNSYTVVNTIDEGVYIIATQTSGSNYVVAKPIESSKTYGYLQKADATESNGTITTDAANEFTIKGVSGGYTIQTPDGRYLYMTGTYNSFNVDASQKDGYVWDITINSDGTVNIKNIEKGKTIQYSTQYSSYGAYSSITNTLPKLFKK